MLFLRLDFEADKPRMNAELSIMAELYLKSQWTKIKTKMKKKMINKSYSIIDLFPSFQFVARYLNV